MALTLVQSTIFAFVSKFYEHPLNSVGLAQIARALGVANNE
jgi:hypothetical protein